MSSMHTPSHNEQRLYNEHDSVSPTSSERRRHYGSIRRVSTDSPRGIPETLIGHNLMLLDNERSTLSFLKRLGFGLGHIYNDLCAGVWFSYTLLFLKAVLLINAPLAGILVMLGQVADALATPIIGLLTDRFGTKRQWHIFGTVLTFFTFPMIFSFCPFCPNDNTKPMWWPIVYFLFFIVSFQFAWATVQITHLAMIPEMSITRKDRSDLTATRYAASICSNVIVYVIAWAMLKDHKSKTSNQVGPEDEFRFREISLILTLIGVTMTVLFHFSLAFSGYERRRLLSNCINTTIVSQPKNSDEIDETNGENINEIVSDDESLLVNPDSGDESNNTARTGGRIELVPNRPISLYENFFKSPLLYQNAMLYVFSRLFVTTSLIYMPLWLNEKAPQNTSLVPDSEPSDSFMTTINLMQNDENVQYLATVPLVSFLAAFVASMSRKYTSTTIGHDLAYLIGSIIGICGCAWLASSASNTFTTNKLYLVAILFGSGSSITMISSLCITADMIGENVAQGGFIYSAVTFCDKLITGIVIVVIELLKCDSAECPEYYKKILSFGCGTAALCGILILLTLQLTKSRSNNSIEPTTRSCD